MEDQLGEGLFEVPSSELEAVADRARARGIPVYVLATGEGGGGTRSATRSPVRCLSIVIVWPDAAAYRAADAASFAGAHSILKDIAESLADPRPTVGATKKVAVYVAWD
ncbi:hypothetical protein [Nonomuraea sp. SYSU D8015]|uniref:hypothetical protein n=1 Tax=Nonomuraea sp. SYSU D8015 TaxID=2593644 RepID=UPI001660FAA9|nr:hypothetical protein [Nonomuraea sp. SYSU D8015]